MLPKVGQSFGLGVIVNSHFPPVCPSLATLDADATAMAQTATCMRGEARPHAY